MVWAGVFCQAMQENNNEKGKRHGKTCEQTGIAAGGSRKIWGTEQFYHLHDRKGIIDNL